MAIAPCTCAGVGSPSLARKYDPQVLNHPLHLQMIARGIIKSGEGPPSVARFRICYKDRSFDAQPEEYPDPHLKNRRRPY